MEEYRCVKCHKLLFKVKFGEGIDKASDGIYQFKPDLGIEVKCLKCSKINFFPIVSKVFFN